MNTKHIYIFIDIVKEWRLLSCRFPQFEASRCRIITYLAHIVGSFFSFVVILFKSVVVARGFQGVGKLSIDKTEQR